MGQDMTGTGSDSRRTTIATAVTLWLVVAALVITAAPGIALAATSERAGGIERIATAARIARAAFDSADSAVLTRADSYPDALTATSLAGVLGAPVLLTDGERLSPDTASALSALEVETVYLLGGSGAITERVAEVLEANYTVARISGGDRYSTASALARDTVRRNDGVIGSFEGRTTVLMASGENFADALTGAPLAYENNLPVLLTRRDAMPTGIRSALAALDPEAVIILGGTSAVAGSVANSIEQMDIDVTRIAGANRSDTSLAFNTFTQAASGQQPGQVIITRGDTFPDALTGATLAGRESTPIVLVDSPTVLGSAATAYLAERCEKIDVVRALGGVRAVADSVLTRAVGLATNCP